MRISEKTCEDFVDVLASKSAAPGGGGAAALTGAIGIALGSMVCNLTIGKKKYAEHEESVKSILEKARSLEKDLIGMIDEDAECFLPLSKAYGLPSSTDEEKKIKSETMENALKKACEVPIKIVKVCYESIKLHEDLVDKGSRLAISDIGVGVQCLRAAILSGQLNVLININSIKDEKYVNEVRNEINSLVEEGVKICDEVYLKVEKALNK
ncbi:methenyltetrahydrofolate cyclohydrolase (5 [[Clostridium] sordellii]|uniref:Methenyltetrahydrofolate cyclohydrolase (5,10-methenyltetrahydrofolate 5-hydrolase) n=1 Tax=Paraclostridium sordellii TaxID=1505 RepID=A0ABM9RSG8_PARSO|nr:cyclodeaminase/cyclohydrolase family protein [Paeniclostridium sordellii]CEJ75013.1 Methenyltetrahydrofolate cyclohydrolase (5,10-methenyltetrahydrofolate 5-hydrolase) [[Clostridium] sordellii] [Paeniclostridium sordellii]CEN70781.1 methenyltetrahydrofolate cyclohydrolase (5 [[Clostridium] sordellii] [Paeniclostridium sordellii]CEN74077.1 methenyltetrahydrofolate cyclohydrolase (5 [[Clostridium] sordellii] [Paeniclostridium sordellii]CEO29868.1 methenyltetrahydrofolate cyclohydrolase (5 [[Cl